MCAADPADGTAADEGHVFDQTNGVLGIDEEEDAERRPGPSDGTPSRFGVPPITSL